MDSVRAVSKKDSLNTTVGQAAERITKMVLDGELHPRQKLNEVDFAAKLGVSRNSLREAFRLLIRDGLLVYRSHRGVFVRSYEPSEIRDLYAFREFIENAALAKYHAEDALSDYVVRQMLTITEASEKGQAEQDWTEVAKRNTEFHLAIFSLSGNQRVVQLGRDILIQSKLIFMDSGHPESVHGPFVARNKEIAVMLEAGEIEIAQQLLADYLVDSRDIMVRR